MFQLNVSQHWLHIRISPGLLKIGDVCDPVIRLESCGMRARHQHFSQVGLGCAQSQSTRPLDLSPGIILVWAHTFFFF